MATTATLVSNNPLSSYALSPRGITFENQESDEKIILLSRAHIVTLVPALIMAIILCFAPVFAEAALSFLKISILLSIGTKQIFLINLFWYLVIFGFIFYKFIFWYFNVYLVTNERIIDFDFMGLLSKKIAFTRLEQIEDVTPKTVGFFGTFFNFGNVLIQTAAEEQEFEFENVALPDLVAEVIFEQVKVEGIKPR